MTTPSVVLNSGGKKSRRICTLACAGKRIACAVFLGPPLFKTKEGVVIGFQICAWAPKKNNKNSEKKIKFGPPPPCPLETIFRSFLFVVF